MRFPSFAPMMLLVLLGLLQNSLVAVQAGDPAPVAPPRTGFFEDELKEPATGKHIINYALASPTSLPAEHTLALVVAFHGSGNPCAAHAQYWSDALKREGLASGYVVMAPKAVAAGWTNVDDEPVTKCLDWVLKTYPIDLRRVYLVGFSSGGWYISRYGLAHQERFAGVSTYASGMAAPPPPPAKGDTGIPTYVVIGTEDPFHDKGVDSRNALKAAGYPFVFREVAGMGHQLGNDAVVADNVRWMHQLRARKQPLAKDQEEFIRQGRSAKAAQGLWSAADSQTRLVDIGGIYAEAVALQVAKDKSAAIRLAVAKACQLGRFGSEALGLMIRYLEDADAEVRAAAIAAVGNAADWNVSEARLALVKLVGDKKTTQPDRELALSALERAAALITLAVDYDDAQVVPGLVALLDSSESMVRARAFGILSKASKEGFGYDPDASASDRSKAAMQWQDWSKKKCGRFAGDAPGARKP